MTSYERAQRTTTILADGLDEIAGIVGLQLELSEPAIHLAARADAARADRFKIVVVGGFNRGKSTLLNAVLGYDILPQKVVPSTAIITLIEFSEQPTARVRFADEKTPDEVLSIEEFRRRFVLGDNDFVEGQADKDRFSNVDHAVVGYPIELCRHRVELVDSPGLQDDPIRTARTERFLTKADAVVMVLDATMLLQEEEVHFLNTKLLPLGFTNIFFIINKWNMIDQMIIDESQASKLYADLEARIAERLTKFCEIAGKDYSAERIFRVNALAALRGRMRTPRASAMIEESNVPAFEESLQRFLVEDRGKARTDVILGAIKSTTVEVQRFIDTQVNMAKKSIAEIEAEQKALNPKLDRLRGIKRHIEGYLDAQSANLQDRLTTSFQHQISKIDKDLDESVDKFDLSELTKGVMIWVAATDWARPDENKFVRKVERHLLPQVTRFLEQEFAEWQVSVVKNEMLAVSIDVQTHLQEEAAEYQRVLWEIEERLGIAGGTLQIKELVERWVSSGGTEGGAAGIEFTTIGVAMLGDMSYLIGGIVVDIVAEVVYHLAAAWIPVVGALVTGVRLALREMNIRDDMKKSIIQGLREKLRELEHSRSALIRTQIKTDFDGLRRRISGSIDEEIAMIDASLQTVIDHKRESQFSAEEEQQRLEAARDTIEAIVDRIRATV
jgi:small GTP-binding protein